MSKSAIYDKAMDYIDDHIELTKQEIRVGIYEYFRYDTTKISTFITILTGSLSLDRYITNRKAYFAALELENNLDQSITDIAMKYHYSESSAFSRAIKNQYGLSPTQIRSKKPPISDNRLTIDDYIDKPTSYLAKVLDHYQNEDFSQSGCLEYDYLESFIEATNEYGFSTETCCLISMLSYHMNIPFAYMLEKCFDMVIDIRTNDDFPRTIEEEVAVELGIKSLDDLYEICRINNVDFVYDLNSEMVRDYYEIQKTD